MPFDLDERWRPISPTCRNCRHLDWVPRDYRFHATCAAFPEGVPIEIWNGDHDHRSPFPGDRGVHYAAMTEDDEQIREIYHQLWLAGFEERARLLGEGKLDPVKPRPLPNAAKVDEADAKVRAAS
jgi:hypothetical protein